MLQHVRMLQSRRWQAESIVGCHRTGIAQTSPNAPVTLLIHDWGCMYGYNLAAKHPALVARTAALDIGDYNSGTYVRWLPFSHRDG
jgi:pimeloyl-ACP methyl ester carboxylesterase